MYINSATQLIPIPAKPNSTGLYHLLPVLCGAPGGRGAGGAAVFVPSGRSIRRFRLPDWRGVLHSPDGAGRAAEKEGPAAAGPAKRGCLEAPIPRREKPGMADADRVTGFPKKRNSINIQPKLELYRREHKSELGYFIKIVAGPQKQNS